MSLPPGFLDELRTRLSMGQVAGRKVMWDNKKSNPGKGDLWAIQLKREKRFTCYLAKSLNSLYFDCTGLNVESARIFGRPTESCNGPSRWANDNRK